MWHYPRVLKAFGVQKQPNVNKEQKDGRPNDNAKPVGEPNTTGELEELEDVTWIEELIAEEESEVPDASIPDNEPTTD